MFRRISQCVPRLNSLKKKQRKIILLQRIEAQRNLPIDVCHEVTWNTRVLYIHLHCMNIILTTLINFFQFYGVKLCVLNIFIIKHPHPQISDVTFLI
jgi:hypothetical protein